MLHDKEWPAEKIDLLADKIVKWKKGFIQSFDPNEVNRSGECHFPIVRKFH